MCDFKRGDEVVYVGDQGGPMSDAYWAWLRGGGGSLEPHGMQKGDRFIIKAVISHPEIEGLFGLTFGSNEAFPHTSFRKVQRRDLTAWLKTSIGNTDKLDKRQTKKVRA